VASKRERVLAAVKALVATALPNADVRRNPAKAVTVGAGGAAHVFDGDPGDPDVDLSPVTYNYTHRIPIELAAYESATKTREQVVDEMASAIGAAVAADRYLGGLCCWLEAEAPTSDDVEAMGAAPLRSVDLIIVAHYATSDPLN